MFSVSVCVHTIGTYVHRVNRRVNDMLLLVVSV